MKTLGIYCMYMEDECALSFIYILKAPVEHLELSFAEVGLSL